MAELFGARLLPLRARGATTRARAPFLKEQIAVRYVE
jgi:hypothetical protein